MFTAGPALLGPPAGGGTPHVGPLDPYTTGMFCCLGLDRLIGAYSGPSIRVRNGTTNVETDIGFDATTGDFDTTALASALGSADGFLAKWYDQSGSGNHFVQATAGNQATVAVAGVWPGYLFFNRLSFTESVLCVNASAAGDQFKAILQKSTQFTRVSLGISWEYGNAAVIGSGTSDGQMQENNANVPDTMATYMAGSSNTGYYASGGWHGALKAGQAQLTNLNHSVTPSVILYDATGVVPVIEPGWPQQSGVFPGTPTTFASQAYRTGCRTDGFGNPEGKRMFVTWGTDQSANAVAICTAV